MSQGKNIAIALLSVSTCVSAFWAWRAESQLTEKGNRAPVASPTALPQAPDESASVEEAAAAVKPIPATQTSAESAAPPAPPTQTRHREPADLRAIRESPEFQRLQSLARQGVLDFRYAELFRKLHLSPNDLEKLKALLLERQNIRGDVLAASREEGLDLRGNRDTIQNLIRENEADSDSALRSLLGEAGYQTYAQYESTQTERNMTRRIDQRLSYAATPLSSTQTEQLIALLANARTAQNTQSAGGPAINNAVIAQAQGFLTPTQIEVLTQMQTEMNAAMEMAHLMQARGVRRMPAININPD